MKGADFRLIDRNWAGEIENALDSGATDLSLIAPFIKLATARRFIGRRASSKLRVITRFNLNDFYQGVSDLDALERIIEAGGKVRGLWGLHSKLFLFDRRIAIAGSANMSEAALLRNHEFGFVSGEPVIVERCQQYFNELWELSKVDATLGQIAEWRAQVSSASTKSTPIRPNLPDFGVRAKLNVSQSPFLADVLPAPDDRQYFVKFFGSGNNRANVDDAIAFHVEKGGCHWACTYGRRPRNVEDGARMFTARLTKRPNDIRIFGQAVGSRHRDGVDDASEKEIDARPWKKDWPYYVRVHDAEFINGKLSDGVSLNELMRRFDEDAFMSTQRNARDGRGNRNPRRSLSQQPQIELTPLAAGWLSRELDEAFRRHGRIDLTSAEFDWPQEI